MPTTQAIEKKSDKPQTLRQQLAGDYFKSQVALALPKHMTPDRFIRVGLTALMKTPKLLDCTPESVLECMLNCSALGLEPDGRRAHLIPYGNKCTLIVDFKGLVELAKRSGDVSNVFAQIVCDKDTFAWENGEITHRIDFRQERGEMYAAYAIIMFKDGSKQCDVMTKSEIKAIQARSRAGQSGPWITDFNEMAKKTVFRRASKWITLSPEVADAYEKDDGDKIITAPAKPIHTLDVESSPLTQTLPEPEPTPEPELKEVAPKKKPEPTSGNLAAGDDQIPGLEAPVKPAAPPVEPPPKAPEPSADDAECNMLIGSISELAVKDKVTEPQIVKYAKKNHLCGKQATSLNEFVAPKLKLIVENWPHIIEAIRAS